MIFRFKNCEVRITDTQGVPFKVLKEKAKKIAKDFEDSKFNDGSYAFKEWLGKIKAINNEETCKNFDAHSMSSDYKNKILNDREWKKLCLLLNAKQKKFCAMQEAGLYENGKRIGDTNVNDKPDYSSSVMVVPTFGEKNDIKISGFQTLFQDGRYEVAYDRLLTIQKELIAAKDGTEEYEILTQQDKGFFEEFKNSLDRAGEWCNQYKNKGDGKDYFELCRDLLIAIKKTINRLEITFGKGDTPVTTFKEPEELPIGDSKVNDLNVTSEYKTGIGKKAGITLKYSSNANSSWGKGEITDKEKKKECEVVFNELKNDVDKNRNYDNESVKKGDIALYEKYTKPITEILGEQKAIEYKVLLETLKQRYGSGGGTNTTAPVEAKATTKAKKEKAPKKEVKEEVKETPKKEPTKTETKEKVKQAKKENPTKLAKEYGFHQGDKVFIKRKDGKRIEGIVEKEPGDNDITIVVNTGLALYKNSKGDMTNVFKMHPANLEKEGEEKVNPTETKEVEVAKEEEVAAPKEEKKKKKEPWTPEMKEEKAKFDAWKTDKYKVALAKVNELKALTKEQTTKDAILECIEAFKAAADDTTGTDAALKYYELRGFAPVKSGEDYSEVFKNLHKALDSIYDDVLGAKLNITPESGEDEYAKYDGYIDPIEKKLKELTEKMQALKESKSE